MNNRAIQIRYEEFIRSTGRVRSVQTIREFIHFEILRGISHLYSAKLYLHGGCFMRYVNGSNRYSLDIDLSVTDFAVRDKDVIQSFSHELEQGITGYLKKSGFLLESSIHRLHANNGGIKLRFKMNQLKELFADIFSTHPADININIDLDTLLPCEHTRIANLISDPSIRIPVLAESSHMARKITAVLQRTQLRDFYDLEQYLRQGVSYDLDVVRARLEDNNLSHDIIAEKLI